MISLDVNVLVYAFRQDSVKHEECRDWLNKQIRDRNGLVLIDIVLVGFLRICTHSKIFREPSLISEATNFLAVMISNQNVSLTSSTPETWHTFSRILDKTNVQGNKISDAWLAAISIERNLTWISTDSDFNLFPDLKLQNPFKPK
jgi:toxin-antitoxin system PIN domain toxin